MNKLDDLITLQAQQRRHDEKAHRDILSLSVQRRITHMVLHFAKYTGALSQQPDDQKFRQTLIDTLIIALASANSLNVDLAARVRQATNAHSSDELVQAMHMSRANVRQNTFLGLASATGVMAKACESLDHLEKHDFRGTLEDQIIQVISLVFAAICVLKLDILALIKQRWEFVERKSIFYSAEDSQIVGDTKNCMTIVKTNSR